MSPTTSRCDDLYMAWTVASVGGGPPRPTNATATAAMITNRFVMCCRCRFIEFLVSCRQHWAGTAIRRRGGSWPSGSGGVTRSVDGELVLHSEQCVEGAVGVQDEAQEAVLSGLDVERDDLVVAGGGEVGRP